jgi:restriction endonuclease S subunit
MQYFTVWSSEIKGRFDPYYLKTIPIIKSVKTSYPLISLTDLLKEPPQYGANEAAVQGNSQTDVRYIRITDIDEYGNLKDNDWKTTKTIEDKYLLEDNDILFARSGATAGKTFIYRKDFGKAIFAGYLIRFRFDEKKVDPRYVFYYTQLSRYANWINLIQRPSGQPNINSEEFRSFEIPLPPFTIQNQIVNIMQSAYRQKKQKETEAQKLLDSIDDYVLDELGIRMPEIIIKKCFLVCNNEVVQRLDPLYYSKDVFSFLKEFSYDVKPLEGITYYLKTGFAAGNSQ